MLVILLVIAVVVLVAALAVVYMCVGNGAGNDAAVQRLLVDREQRLAEARMQRIMLDTVEQMFKAVRGDR